VVGSDTIYYKDAKTGNRSISCIPGVEKCVYMKNNVEAFKLKCECSLESPEPLDPKDAADHQYKAGYCPIPSLWHIQNNISWLKKMWLGDGCHTYDRNNIHA